MAFTIEQEKALAARLHSDLPFSLPLHEYWGTTGFKTEQQTLEVLESRLVNGTDYLASTSIYDPEAVDPDVFNEFKPVRKPVYLLSADGYATLCLLSGCPVALKRRSMILGLRFEYGIQKMISPVDYALDEQLLTAENAIKAVAARNTNKQIKPLIEQALNACAEAAKITDYLRQGGG